MFESLSTSYSLSSESANPHIIAGLLLCGCANTVALLSRRNPNPPGQRYRLICAYLHDSQQFANMSFANAGYKLADTGTKMASIVAARRSFLPNGMFLSDILAGGIQKLGG